MEEIDRANASPLPTLGTGPSQLADTAGAPNDWGCSGDGNDLILHFPAGLFPEQLANGALVGARGEDLHGVHHHAALPHCIQALSTIV